MRQQAARTLKPGQKTTKCGFTRQTHEMIVCFKKRTPTPDPIIIEGSQIEQVQKTKL